MRSRLDPTATSRGLWSQAAVRREDPGQRRASGAPTVVWSLCWVPPRSSQRASNWLSQAHPGISPFDYLRPADDGL